MTSSDSPFDEMKRINAPREIVVHAASKLEPLVSMGDSVIERYHSAVKGRYELWEHHKIYAAIEAELAGSELEYGVSDLQDIVRAYCNQDDSEQEAITRGLYTGALASVLTKRNREKGERTHICLNGDGNRFPYLLYFAHTLDELTIDDFKGDFIVAGAASYGGAANNIGLTNITGDRAGEYIAFGNGRVGTVTLVNITGDGAGGYIALDKGRVRTITLTNITGKWTGRDIALDKGRVNTLLAVNNKGKNYLFGNHAIRTITSLNGFANAQQIQSFLDELAQPDRAPEHYAAASKQLGELLREEKQ